MNTDSSIWTIAPGPPKSIGAPLINFQEQISLHNWYILIPGPISSCRQLDWKDHTRTDIRAHKSFKLSFGRFFASNLKRPNDNLKDLCVYLLLYQSLYDLPNPTVSKSVLALTNALGRNLISVLGLTTPLGCRLISALVLTCQPGITLDSTLLGCTIF